MKLAKTSLSGMVYTTLRVFFTAFHIFFEKNNKIPKPAKTRSVHKQLDISV